MSPAVRAQKIRANVALVVLKESEVEITLTAEGVLLLAPQANRAKSATKSICVRTRLITGAGGAIITARDGGGLDGRLDKALLRAIVRANHWREMLEAGRARSAYDLARHEGCRVSYIQRHLPLAFLSPALVEAILEGRQPADCALSELLDRPPELSWQ